MSGVIDWLFSRSATCERLRNDLALHQGALMDSHDRLKEALATARKARAEADELKVERMLLTQIMEAGQGWRRDYEREAAARREAQMEILRLRERLEANRKSAMRPGNNMKAKQDKAPAELAALACYATGPNKSPALNREPGAERWAGGSAELLPPVLDACCGSRMFWFDRADKRTVFVDKRRESHTLPDKSSKGGSRELIVNPDLQADFTALPFGDGEFALVVFDPPHLVGAGKSGWLAKKYGVLQGDWRDEIRKGFAECFRVLRPSGTLVFKWNEEKIPVSEVLELTPEKPLFGNRCGRTAKSHWLVFLKGAEPVGSQALDGSRASSHSTKDG